MRPTILIVECDAVVRRSLRRALCVGDLKVVDVSDERQALATLAAADLDLVVVGSCGADAAASLDLARRIGRARSTLRLIFVTPHSSEQLAIEALRAGVRDYFTHPVPFGELTASVTRHLAAAAANAPRPDLVTHQGGSMIGCGPRMCELRAYIEQVAATNSTVLITGETGTGKELTAALIHQASSRRRQPLVHLNCAAIPDTLLESELFGYERGAFTGAMTPSAGKLKRADGGTVLFDEIGDMSIYAQAKILRLIESREIERLGGSRSLPVDVRVIAATNQDLDRLMAEGRFRKDLYFRLNVARIHLPPLRERKEDLPALVDHYIRQFNRLLARNVDGITDEALAALSRHDWPGNVRELRNVVESIFTTLRGSRIGLMDVPPAYRMGGDHGTVPPVQGERDRLLAALSETKGNKTRTAARLHWSRMTVYRKMAKYRLVEVRNAAPAGPRG